MMNKLTLYVLLALMSLIPQAASKRCGNSWISDSKTCHIGTTPYTPQTPYTPPEPAPTYYDLSKVHISALLRYGNCRDARADGLHDVPTSSPDYRAPFDRDGDGLACEANGQDDGPINFTQSSATQPSTLQRPASLPTQAAVQVQPSLPQISTHLCSGYLRPQNTPVIDGKLQARQQTVYAVDGIQYVYLNSFACSNGLEYGENISGFAVLATEKDKLILYKGTQAIFNNQSVNLSSKVLTIRGEKAAPYADLLNYFHLTAQGLSYVPQKITDDYGEHP